MYTHMYITKTAEVIKIPFSIQRQYGKRLIKPKELTDFYTLHPHSPSHSLKVH